MQTGLAVGRGQARARSAGLPLAAQDIGPIAANFNLPNFNLAKL